MQGKAIIFDVDGVLVDSVPYHFKAWEKMFHENGIAFTYQDYVERVNGLPRLTGIRNMAPKLTDSELERLAAKKQQYFLEFVEQNPLEPLPGVINLLHELKQRDYKVAAASSSKNARTLLETARIADLFDAIITGSDFTHAKPDPEIFLVAATSTATNPSESTVVEDAYLGVLAAKNAGMRAIGLLASKDEQIPTIADFSITSLQQYREILNFLKQDLG